LIFSNTDLAFHLNFLPPPSLRFCPASHGSFMVTSFQHWRGRCMVFRAASLALRILLELCLFPPTLPPLSRPTGTVLFRVFPFTTACLGGKHRRTPTARAQRVFWLFALRVHFPFSGLTSLFSSGDRVGPGGLLVRSRSAGTPYPFSPFPQPRKTIFPFGRQVVRNANPPGSGKPFLTYTLFRQYPRADTTRQTPPFRA